MCIRDSNDTVGVLKLKQKGKPIETLSLLPFEFEESQYQLYSSNDRNYLAQVHPHLKSLFLVDKQGENHELTLGKVQHGLCR